MLEAEDIKQLLRSHGLAPNKLLGQHFLRNTAIIDVMIKETDLSRIDTIVEVGPGLGVLTERLVTLGKKVLLIEKDKGLATALTKQFPGLIVIQEDVLTCNLPKLLSSSERYSVLANLPYNITARFINLMLSETPKPPQEMLLMIQQEVAQRVCAPVGSLTKIGIMAQVYSTPSIVIPDIGPENFYPAPEVTSAVVKLSVKPRPLSIFPQQDDFEKKFWQLVRIGFAAKRKKLTNNLVSGLKISSKEAKELLILAGIDPLARAEELSVEQWVKTVDIYIKNHCR